MKAAIEIDLKFEQILRLVKQLTKQEKIQLSRELEKEEIGYRLTKLLKTFKTKELSLETINSEVELVRKAIYEKQEH